MIHTDPNCRHPIAWIRTSVDTPRCCLCDPPTSNLDTVKAGLYDGRRLWDAAAILRHARTTCLVGGSQRLADLIAADPLTASELRRIATQPPGLPPEPLRAPEPRVPDELALGPDHPLRRTHKRPQAVTAPLLATAPSGPVPTKSARRTRRSPRRDRPLDTKAPA
jgi:hypothetical protein